MPTFYYSIYLIWNYYTYTRNYKKHLIIIFNYLQLSTGKLIIKINVKKDNTFL
jgi:hypothetical protein